MNYFLSFTEEYIQNPDYFGYIMGRIEVCHKHRYDGRTIRFLTKKESWYKFREKYQHKRISARKVKKLFMIIKKDYQEYLS